MTLMTRTWYRFYHRPQQERRLNCSLFIIGHPASNKSMADDIYDILSAPIKAADQAGKAVEHVRAERLFFAFPCTDDEHEDTVKDLVTHLVVNVFQGGNSDNASRTTGPDN